MREPAFRITHAPSASELAEWTGGTLREGDDTARTISNVAPIESAGEADLSFFDNPKYRAAFAESGAGIILAKPKHVKDAPAGATVIAVGDPYRALAMILARLYPDASGPALASAFDRSAATSAPVVHGTVHPMARLEEGVTVEPGAVVGANAAIGRGTVIGANAVVGAGVTIGRDCAIGPNATILHAALGDKVVIHANVAIGQDGFGFAMGPAGHLKVPQVGGVVIQNDVEIGAGTTIDRGANRDTVIGEGSRIDNLVQIAHNVQIGRHCVVVAQTGISGSAVLEDFVAIGGQAGVLGHVTIGMGAQIAASSRVRDSVPPGARWGGAPAKPVREWFREVATLERLAKSSAKD